ncbi:hypothetical protein GIB67_019819 [Kingdonia uniflora]|uniref:C2 domain-containing protein n=1 Tax=Kingdonia uniflora TaxID=39325 RepID=A0A7J7MK79_9MAGN|nr:hypothetical protein GIB67_019819 [Kingdonia uniflora]
MDSFNETNGFCCDYNSSIEYEGGGLLEIYVHHARNIHNICIYDNQDVYAKFSLTYSPDETISTRVINGGGKNPEFNETLRIKIAQLEAVLKCEIWMLSRARNYLEDQLLGFALVPMSFVAGKGKVTHDFTLSSTDLFHSPAGTVQLSLLLHTSVPVSAESSIMASNSSISSEVVLLDLVNLQAKISEVVLDMKSGYGKIEFPDMNVARENKQMLSQYFDAAENDSSLRHVLVGSASFLHLGASSTSTDDYDMTLNSNEENCGGGSVSPNESILNSGYFGSTTTSLSEDRNSIDSMEKKSHVVCDPSNSLNVELVSAEALSRTSGSASPETPTSKKDNDVAGVVDPIFSTKGFKAPSLGNINLEAEQKAMQQQIVDMYMRSMQQFTESLAKMKLPMDIDRSDLTDNGDVVIIQPHPNNNSLDKKKSDGSRVFYGSRAFF